MVTSVMMSDSKVVVTSLAYSCPRNRAPIYAIVLSSAHSGGQPIDCYSRKTDPILYMFSNGHLKL